MTVRLVPRETLDRSAREFHAARFKDAPAPVVVNVDAVLVLGQPREFQWGGVGYRAPPLSYAVGLRLLVAGNALTDLRRTNAPAPVVAHHLHTIALLLRQAMKPVHWWQRRGWLRVFERTDARSLDDLDLLLRGLVAIPDGSPETDPPKRRVTHDYMDALSEFARVFPAWMKDGYPLSWAHYQYGHRHLARAYAREDLRQAVASRAGQTDAKGFKEHLAELRPAAGW